MAAAPAPAHGAASSWLDAVPPSPVRRLVEAAVTSFAAHGYHGTTTREIAHNAGMSPAGVYVHFRSKADLLYEIARIGHVSAFDVVDRALADVESPRERVRTFTETFTSWHAQNHEAARVIQYELPNVDLVMHNDIRDLRFRFERLLTIDIARGIEQGAFTVSSVQAGCTALLSLGIDIARWYRPRVDPTPEALGKTYGELALALLGAGPHVRRA